MIDTICCVLLGVISEVIAFRHMTSPGKQTVEFGFRFDTVIIALLINSVSLIVDSMLSN